jgi:prolyl oligopeptidase
MWRAVQAGHGIGNTKEQREKEAADEWSFLLWQFGQPEFQPAKTH